MIKKERTEPIELIIMRSQNARMDLSEKEKRNYFGLKKGFEGEQQFDTLTIKLENNCLVINGLLLEIDDNETQIDTVLIYQNVIYPIDVKNFEGDYQYNDKGFLFLTKTGKEVKDPLNQLKRCESLFRQLLQSYGYNFHVEPYLVYINPEFTLYHAPRIDSIILPTKLNRFLKKLNRTPSNLNNEHERLAELLISLNLPKSRNIRVPAYEYDRMKKGLISSCCYSLAISLKKNRFVCCNQCGHEEEVDSAVLRHAKEFGILFPDRKITTSGIYEWCGGIVPQKTIRRVLKRNYSIKSSNRWSYFES